jgi:hypothetical protein
VPPLTTGLPDPWQYNGCWVYVVFIESNDDFDQFVVTMLMAGSCLMRWPGTPITRH